MTPPSTVRRPGGRFISFEGIDGAGKSTHIEPLAAWLRARGHTVTCTREPGGTPLAETLRALVLNEGMDALTESLLVFAARRDHLVQRIAPALGRGEVVLCDRFTDATFAYQGEGRGFDRTVLATLERWVQTDAAPGAGQGALIEPDLTLWFDVAPEVAAQRLAQARSPDRFEAESVAFFTRVRQGYLQRLHAAPGRIVRIDAGAPVEAVWTEVLRQIQARSPEAGGGS